MNIPKIPLADWVEVVEDWFRVYFDGLFSFINKVIGWMVGSFETIFALPLPIFMMSLIFLGAYTLWAFMSGRPWKVNIIILFILLLLEFVIQSPSFMQFIVWVTAIAYWLGNKKIALFTCLGLLLIENLGFWNHTMQTLSLVLTAAFISIILGIPLGILCARKNSMNNLFKPILDFMQTMPAFVYLIPAVTFFGLGVVPGVIASVIFAIAPTIRLTNLGIRQVPQDLVEASDAFGSTSMQKLIKLQLPLAIPTIMAGINQTIMLSLSMVVIASLIGAQGVGADVYRAVSRVDTGVGFEAGIVIVILAIILDRITQSLVTKNKL